MTIAHVTLSVGGVVVDAAAGWFADQEAVADGSCAKAGSQSADLAVLAPQPDRCDRELRVTTGIDQADAGKSREVSVVRADCRAVLDRQGGQVRVSR